MSPALLAAHLGGMTPSPPDGIDQPSESNATRENQGEADPPLGFEGHPQINAAEGEEQQQVRRCVGESAPRAHRPRVPAHVDVVWSRHLMEVYQGIAKRLVSSGDRRGALVVIQ